MARNLSRFKRDVSIKPIASANKERVKIDPRTKYIRELKSQIDDVNDILNALSKKGYDGLWASKTLFDRLEQSNFNLVQNKRISKSTINKSRSMTNLTAISRVINDFLDNPTSTPSGVDKRTKSYRDTIAQYSDSREFANSLTNEEIYEFYQIFDDPNYSTIVEKIDPSDFYILGLQVLKGDMSKKDFLATMEQRCYELNDIDLGLALNGMYDKLAKIKNS